MTIDFDALASAARTGGRDAIAALWNAVMRLPTWHFVAVGEFDPQSNAPHVFVSTIDGKRMLFAFTDSDRAHAFAVKNDAKVTPPGGQEPVIGVITQQLPAAIQYAEQYVKAGVEAVIFNYGVNTSGFFIPLTTIGQTWRHSVATVHDFDALANKAFTPGETQENDIGRLLFYLFCLPEWHFLGDGEYDGAPVRVRMENLQANGCAVFTDGVRARAAAKDLVKGEPRHGAMSLDDAVDYLERLQQHEVQHVVFNLGSAPFHLQIDRLRPTLRDVRTQSQRLAKAAQEQLRQNR